MAEFERDVQFWKFCFYGFLKNFRFFEPFLILFFIQTGLSYLQIGILFSIREIVTNVMEVPSGVVADQVGKRSCMLFSIVSYLVSFLLFSILSGVWLFSLAMVLFAVGDAFRTGTHKAIILEYLHLKGWDRWKVHYYGYTRSWAQYGSALSAVVAIFIVFYTNNYRLVFLFSIIPCIACFILLLSYPKALDKTSSSTGAPQHGSRPLPYLSVIKEFGKLLRNREPRKAFLTSNIFDGVFKSLKDYIQPLLEGLALGIPALLYFDGHKRVAIITGGVYFLFHMVAATASNKAGWLHSRIRSQSVLLNSTYILGVLLIALIGFSSHLSLLLISILAFVLYYLLQNIRRPVALGYVSDNIKREVMATGLSGESQLKTLVVAVLSPVIGLLADSLGLGLAIVVVAGVSLLLYPVVRIEKEVVAR